MATMKDNLRAKTISSVCRYKKKLVILSHGISILGLRPIPKNQTKVGIYEPNPKLKGKKKSP